MPDAATSLGKVYFVGAGPGPANLLTLRAVECLRLADVVIRDRLAPAALLVQAPQALIRCVDDYAAGHAERRDRVLADLVALAREGKQVVRLKGGDPWIFGRGADEALALQEAGIPFEVVPGVTAALAAAACAGIPLTDRQLASAVAFVTGHECREPSQLDWSALARFPGTLVVYMGLARVEAIASQLQTHGLPSATPAAVVEWAGGNEQRVVEGNLANVAERVRTANVRGPAVIIIGHVVRHRALLGWFEKRPLFGKTVLLTRPLGQEQGLRERLESLGAAVLNAPVVTIGPPPDHQAVAAALAKLHEFDWLVFTSVNGVRWFLSALLASGDDLRALGRIRLAAIGPQTAAALGDYHLRADLVPAAYSSEGLVAELMAHVRDGRVLLARADRGRDLLREELAKVADVHQVAVYSQRDATELPGEVADALRRQRVDYLFLTSSNVARAFFSLLDDEVREIVRRRVGIVSISPVTRGTVRELGFEVAAEATRYDGEGMVEALLRLPG